MRLKVRELRLKIRELRLKIREFRLKISLILMVSFSNVVIVEVTF